MAKRSYDDITWLHDPKDVIVLANLSDRNYILELPTGLYRLDAGRRMRTLRSILNNGQIRELVSDGQLGGRIEQIATGDSIREPARQPPDRLDFRRSGIGSRHHSKG